VNDLAEAISKYGFPIIAAMGLGYFVYYVWTWATKVVKPIISETQSTLITLIDQVRMLDNDMIRLNQKLNTILALKDKNNDGKINDLDDLDHPRKPK
jgi:hypothetical protein